jgi:hypothetical protein
MESVTSVSWPASAVLHFELDFGRPLQIRERRLMSALLSKEVAMLAEGQSANDQTNPIAILDKELLKTSSFRIEIFELCTLCGARFGIGYFGARREDLRPAEEIEELPRKLIEILAKDHWHHRAHKCLIELGS